MYYFNPYIDPYYNDYAIERKNTPPYTDRFYTFEEAFIKGNIVIKQYDPYRNYQQRMPYASNEKDKLLFMLMALDATCHDLILLLDITPNDQEVLKLLMTYQKKFEETYQMYINKYGGLEPFSSNEKNGFFTYSIMNSPWMN